MTDVRDSARTDTDVRGKGGTAVADAPVGPAPTVTFDRNASVAATPGAPPRIDRRDPRYLALRNFAISMSIFNILGYTVLGFEQPWTWPLLALAVGYATEIVVELVTARANKRPAAFTGNGAWGMYTFLLPTHITALAANMLLYANDNFWPIAFAVVVAIGQKAIFLAPIKGRMRHFMNPSNFGITVTLVAFSWVNIAPPYHFTEDVPDMIRILVPLVILTAGTVLNGVLTKKIPLVVGWVGGFVIQALVRHFIWDVALWAALLPITGVAFVLFTNYMITDPGTTPSSGRAQFMFGASVAGVYGVLIAFNVVYTLFFAVTIVCLARGLLWWGIWLRDRSRRANTPEVRPAVT
ncbi:enediyne biosynthesis protein [Micromonospora sp. DSM 115977]|uniref:Enediyne biosynthesis protein n=1 Tax=Micromonospora reichwaldensis TaxID=3075516 RepID=A0ABU2X032_9ACTN|nr:enediyne biosynthesis protein [Micromonospora sp. DSM 115977]MDT0531486.1 enediyne biosynthesis protein [Micromonospora sp. DSM 115977]